MLEVWATLHLILNGETLEKLIPNSSHVVHVSQNKARATQNEAGFFNLISTLRKHHVLFSCALGNLKAIIRLFRNQHISSTFIFEKNVLHKRRCTALITLTPKQVCMHAVNSIKPSIFVDLDSPFSTLFDSQNLLLLAPLVQATRFHLHLLLCFIFQ